MNNILAAQVLRSHLSEITDGAYKTAIEIAIETLYKDAYEDWKKWYSDELSAREYLELTEEEWYYWLLGGEKVEEERLLSSHRERNLRQNISIECLSTKQKDSKDEDRLIHNYNVCQDKKRYDFKGCPDDFECINDYTFLALCDEISDDFDCKKCWKNFLRGAKC